MDLHWRLKDVENAPAFDSTCNPRCSSDRAIHPIAKQLLHVPHYNLADNLNFQQIKFKTINTHSQSTNTHTHKKKHTSILIIK